MPNKLILPTSNTSFWTADLSDASPEPSGGRCEGCGEISHDDFVLGHFSPLKPFIRVCRKCAGKHEFISFEDSLKGSAM